MDYKNFIQNILESRGRFCCGNQYHERHHILPKCMGGSNEDSNLIDLYANEHYEAHKLLALENPTNNLLQYAWWMMSHSFNDNRERYFISKEDYEMARIAFKQSLAKREISEETRLKLSKASKGKIVSKETREKISSAQKGRAISEEAKKKMSIAQKIDLLLRKKEINYQNLILEYLTLKKQKRKSQIQ